MDPGSFEGDDFRVIAKPWDTSLSSCDCFLLSHVAQKLTCDTCTLFCWCVGHSTAMLVAWNSVEIVSHDLFSMITMVDVF